MPAIAPRRASNEPAVSLLRDRLAEGGGFANRPGGGARPDATAWGALALRAGDEGADMRRATLDRLARDQSSDGRVALSSDHPESIWPTPLAILAWEGSPDHADAQSRALKFLVGARGKRTQRSEDSPLGHDARLKGWPWIEGTFAWVGPTALGVLALRASGRGNHPRAHEGVELILDRQLPAGGWNYGNSLVFGRELLASPESTGMALAALAGRAEEPAIAKSLDYLIESARELRTPLGLGWALLGLSAWERRPPEAGDWIEDCLARQGRFGAYHTAQLAIALIARGAPEGLLAMLERPEGAR